ncbi:MAG: pyruvate, phosphate dikinase [Bacteroidetes bacterium]|nr:pyruvate, phosphate dikinase [Bacteroidota bacterium]
METKVDVSTKKYVFQFGSGKADGDKTQKDLLGGKGANLAEMSSIGLPVPPGMTLTTECCSFYSEHEGEWPNELEAQVRVGVSHLEAETGSQFGDASNPLLLSVRSGAAVSMPGMMDTVLNLGLNDTVVDGLAERSGNVRFAYDAYRRFIDMFGDVVMNVSHDHFEDAIDSLKVEKNASLDVDLTADDLKELVEQYKEIFLEHTGQMFPEDPNEQLRLSINAVFGSWESDRARKYRQINKIKDVIGTAVNVQAMVFGNMGPNSGTGVLFTRNPSTGENKLYGEFLVDAQGEDVVAGIRTPEDISKMESAFPEAFSQLVETTKRLENHYQNMQDIEFTIQDGKLYLLQTRNGERTGASAIKIAVDMVEDGIVEKEVAIRDLVEPAHIDQLLHPQFESTETYQEDVIARGLPASPGAAVGQVVFSAEHAEEAAAEGRKVILVRTETSPEDVGGMNAAQGILTSRGGMTSHAAVVARGWGKPCVAGCGDISIDYGTASFTNGESTIKEGDWISINGSTGEIIQGNQKLVEASLSAEFARFMSWVDEFRDMNVRANADTPEDARRAIDFGAEGIGLCRTEHMFFEGDRIDSMRQMILAETEEARRASLDKLLPFQKEDFRAIFREMDGFPVTIRLLDPPLHEFLPHGKEEQDEMARKMGVSIDAIQGKVKSLAEFNPMLGHRGCRLGITYPEITEMQTRAIIEAAVELSQEGVGVLPEIMVPLVGTVEEFVHQKTVIEKTAKAVFDEKGSTVKYLIGTMIEIPRAALMAEAIAREASFFSFGTNDLTQMAFGYSRDDAGKFLPEYVNQKILKDDPFQSLDIEGVGQLVRMGTERGREGRSDLKIGICGEHGGDPASIHFFYELGMSYVSCSPYRVPIAKLASTQAKLQQN